MSLKSRLLVWYIKRRIEKAKSKGVSMKISDILDSTKGKGISKKFLAMLLTGTIAPLLEQFGFSHDLVIALVQLGLGYIGVQGVADAAFNFKNGAPKQP